MLDLTGSPTAAADLDRELATRMAWVVVLGDREAANQFEFWGNGPLRRLILTPADADVYAVLQKRSRKTNLSAGGGVRAVAVGLQSGDVVDFLTFKDPLSRANLIALWERAETS